MTTVNSTNSTTNTSTTNSASSSTGKGMSSLGINDFITLMTTQLKYQDPTNPQDSSAFVAQLAQFSSVSGIQEMNTSLSSLLSEVRSSQATSATNLVGHDVMINSDKAAITSGDTLSGAVNTPSGTTAISVSVLDSSGQVVRQLSVGPSSSGTSSFTWDGKDDSGQAVASGTYSLKATAVVNGKTEAETTMVASKVASVTIDSTDSSVVLNTNQLGAVKMSDVKQII